MLHSSFAAWAQAEVLPVSGSRDRLDGLNDSGNRDIFGRFRYLGRKWEVHGDTRVERVLRAYQAIQVGKLSNALVVERARVRDCLNLAPALRGLKEPKYFYVYETL